MDAQAVLVGDDLTSARDDYLGSTELLRPVESVGRFPSHADLARDLPAVADALKKATKKAKLKYALRKDTSVEMEGGFTRAIVHQTRGPAAIGKWGEGIVTKVNRLEPRVYTTKVLNSVAQPKTAQPKKAQPKKAQTKRGQPKKPAAPKLTPAQALHATGNNKQGVKFTIAVANDANNSTGLTDFTYQSAGFLSLIDYLRDAVARKQTDAADDIRGALEGLCYIADIRSREEFEQVERAMRARAEPDGDRARRVALVESPYYSITTCEVLNGLAMGLRFSLLRLSGRSSAYTTVVDWEYAKYDETGKASDNVHLHLHQEQAFGETTDRWFETIDADLPRGRKALRAVLLQQLLALDAGSDYAAQHMDAHTGNAIMEPVNGAHGKTYFWRTRTGTVFKQDAEDTSDSVFRYIDYGRSRMRSPNDGPEKDEIEPYISIDILPLRCSKLFDLRLFALTFVPRFLEQYDVATENDVPEDSGEIPFNYALDEDIQDYLVLIFGLREVPIEQLDALGDYNDWYSPRVLEDTPEAGRERLRLLMRFNESVIDADGKPRLRSLLMQVTPNEPELKDLLAHEMFNDFRPGEEELLAAASPGALLGDANAKLWPLK